MVLNPPHQCPIHSLSYGSLDFRESLLIVYSPMTQEWEVTTAEEEITGPVATVSVILYHRLNVCFDFLL